MEVLTCESTVLSTCHTGAINDIAFPRDLDRCDHYSRLISIHVTKKECNDFYTLSYCNNQLNYSYDKVEGELGGRGELGEEG